MQRVGRWGTKYVLGRRGSCVVPCRPVLPVPCPPLPLLLPPHSLAVDAHQLWPRLHLQLPHAYEVLGDFGEALLVLVYQERGPVLKVLIDLL